VAILLLGCSFFPASSVGKDDSYVVSAELPFGHKNALTFTRLLLPGNGLSAVESDSVQGFAVNNAL
jgi:hypothetical protein